jgi:hypothetical protein
LEDIIKQKVVIDIDTAPNWDNVSSGICVVANQDIIILLNFNEESGEFDGFSIFKNTDFEKYRIWNKEDYVEIKNNNSYEILEKTKFDDFLDLETSLKKLKPELISIYTYDDENSFYVGRILSVNKDSVEIRLVDKESKWTDIEIIELNEISCIGFSSSYEMKLAKTLSN